VTAPLIFFGRRDDEALLQAASGFTDAGESYTLLARSNRLAPAGAGGECIFTLYYLTVRHTGALTLRVTPIVDDVRYPSVTVTFDDAGPAPLLEVREIGFSHAYSRGGVERGRFALRGTWVQVEIESEGAIGSDVVVELGDLEYEIVRESK
jgi:hypothetical protein